MDKASKLRGAFLDSLETYVGKPLDSVLFFDRHQYSKELQHENYRVSSYYNDTLSVGYIVDNTSQRIISFHSMPKQTIEKANELAKKRSDAIKKHFSAWDGSHIKLEKAIKLSLADPNSYEHISTKHNVEDDTINVITTFRAKNAFGGFVVKQAKGKYTIKGEQLLAEYVD